MGHNTLFSRALRYLAWFALTGCMIVILEELITSHSTMVHVAVLFFSAYTSAHLAEID